MLPRGLALGLAGLLLLTVCGCGSRETVVERGNREGVLHSAVGAEPESLDPHVITAYTTMQLELAFFEGLTAVDEATSKPLPAAARSWEVSDDGLTWTFHLAPDLKWSDGTAITAPTFRDSFARALAPAMAAEYAYVLYNIKHAAAFNAGEITDFARVGVRAPDDATLVFELAQPTPGLASILTLAIAFPVPLHVIAQHGDLHSRSNRWTRPENIVGNGPFKVAEWSPNQRLTGVRNPNFRDAANVTLNGVAFYPYENATAQEAAFRAGQLHLTSEVPLTKIAPYRAEHPDQLRIDPFVLTGFMRFNTTRPPFDDVRVRRALTMAIDRTALTDHVFKAGETVATSLNPPGIGGYTARAAIGYDPDQARTLLAAAGYPGGKGFPVVEAMSRAREMNQSLLEAIQQMWRRELGIEMRVAMKEQRVWLDDETQLNYELSNARWIGDYVDPLTFLELFLTDSGNNSTGWGNATYDQLVSRASATADEAQRFELYQQAEAILIAESPIAPIYHGTQSYLIRPEVKGWPPSLLGFHRYHIVRLEP
ncbi:peptide ABC transporter substrate-binding protein [Synoicihabitans lomoniglobus]|uniref:Peptide ABC transporter substrate-binding protein n=1 Tax=Synoicihabitans lomoniglobus TaxID=2909285 RepID=A0AAF0CMX6_9BACT|nr:peptide ABC transporter substrate-binding protein [Opitutaceae bacterium LMO-M01]WED64758.1 peptide ABC transporter substrate-binding protein [Opitutaceae bacterium LMO-M01]